MNDLKISEAQETSLAYVVAVYGSLKKGFGNHRLLSDSVCIGEFVTEPIFKMKSLGGFPGVMIDGANPIKVEVYQVNQSTFERLDRLESHPRFYKREIVKVFESNTSIKEPLEVWMYILNPDSHYLSLPDYTNTDDDGNIEWLNPYSYD